MQKFLKFDQNFFNYYLFGIFYFYREYAFSIKRQTNCMQMSDLYVSIVLDALVWPILIALDASLLFDIRDHHNNATVLLQNHFPKVIKSVWHWSLSGYVGVWLHVTVHVVSIYVAVCLVSLVTRDFNSTMIVYVWFCFC